MRAMESTFDELFSDLNTHQRRRLYFLLAALSKDEAATAVELAARMENFVLSQAVVSCAKSAAADAASPVVERAVGADAPDTGTDAKTDLGASNDGAARAEPMFRKVVPAPAPAERGSALSGAQRLEFRKAMDAGATNSQLGARFGLTPRQANALRMGFMRAQSGGVSGRPAGLPPAATAAEREQEETFLRQKALPPQTIEDVVRFLRQLGDIVLRRDGGYLVNHRLELTSQELIMHANRKRTANGKRPFELDLLDSNELESQSS